MRYREEKARELWTTTTSVASEEEHVDGIDRGTERFYQTERYFRH